MVDVEIDLSAAFAGFDRMRGRARDLKRVWDTLRPELRGEARDHFDETQGPDGTWAPWAPSTMEKFRGERAGVAAERIPLSPAANALRRGRRVNTRADGRLSARGLRRLQNMLGRLKTAFAITTAPSYMEARWIVSWAWVHHRGGPVGHGAEIPARPFAFVRFPFVSRAAELVAQAIAEAF